jgi:hypothetical protein
MIFIFAGKIRSNLKSERRKLMKTTIALIIKFIVTMAAAWIAFMMFGTVAFWTVVIIAFAGTVINYLIGDLLILPRWGNVIAAICDGILGGLAAWMILAVAPVTYAFMNSVYIFAIIVAVAEFFFHMYLISAHIVEKKKTDEDFYKKDKLNYNTETGGEIYPYANRNRTDNSTSGTVNRGNMQDNYGGFKNRDK